MFLFHDDITLLSYVPKKGKGPLKKNILLISTAHDTPDRNNDVKLPEIVSYYNQTKVGGRCLRSTQQGLQRPEEVAKMADGSILRLTEPRRHEQSRYIWRCYENAQDSSPKIPTRSRFRPRKAFHRRTKELAALGGEHSGYNQENNRRNTQEKKVETINSCVETINPRVEKISTVNAYK